MTRSGLLACLGAFAVATAGCSHTYNDSNASAPADPTKPTATADENTWGGYLAEQGKLHGQDVGMKPYIYVIPSGDSVAANSRRQNETGSVVNAVGPILIPGGMLILGGPDPKQTTLFILDVSKQLKTDAMKGIVVMVVSDASEQAADTAALKPSGAMVRFVSM
jgi:hypothetical protein